MNKFIHHYQENKLRIKNSHTIIYKYLIMVKSNLRKSIVIDDRPFFSSYDDNVIKFENRY